MSLAHLFFLKNPRPKFRRLWSRARRATRCRPKFMWEALEPRVLLSATPIMTQHVVLDPNAPSTCASQAQTAADGIVVLSPDETEQADNATESVTTVNPTADTSEFTSLSPAGIDHTVETSDTFGVTAGSLNQEVLQPLVSEAINRLT